MREFPQPLKLRCTLLASSRFLAMALCGALGNAEWCDYRSRVVMPSDHARTLMRDCAGCASMIAQRAAAARLPHRHVRRHEAEAQPAGGRDERRPAAVPPRQDLHRVSCGSSVFAWFCLSFFVLTQRAPPH